MAIVFLMNEEIARGMVCFFHQKKHSYLIFDRTLYEANRTRRKRTSKSHEKSTWWIATRKLGVAVKPLQMD
jgi:hypothetical protein